MKYYYTATAQREVNGPSLGLSNGEFHVITAAEMYQGGRKKLLCLTLRSDRNGEERPFYLANNSVISSFFKEGGVEEPQDLLERRVLLFRRNVESSTLPRVENVVVHCS